MLPKQRVLSAIQHQKVDRLPCGELCIDDAAIADTLTCDRIGFEQRRDFVDRIGLDLICLAPPWPAQNGLPQAADIDAAFWTEVRRWSAETDRAVFVMLDGVFGWGVRLLGFNNLMMAFVRKSQDLLDLMDNVEALNKQLSTQAAATGAHVVLIADDIAYNRGPFVSLDMLRSLYFPGLACQVSHVHSLGLPAFFHADGDLKLVLDDLVASGLNGLQGLEQFSGMDLPAIYQRYGDRLCLWGNLSPDELTLERGDQALLTSINAVVPAGALNGGYIFGTSSGIVPGSRPDNLRRVYRLVRDLPPSDTTPA